MIENKLYDEIAVGDRAGLVRRVTADDLIVFARASGNLNPMHLPNVDRDGDGTADPSVAPSMWVASLASAVIGNKLPGPGTLYAAQDFVFHDRARIGDELTVEVTVTAKEDGGVLVLDTVVGRSDGRRIASGRARVIAPPTRIRLDHLEVPEIVVDTHPWFDRLIEAARRLPPLDTVVVAPDDPHSLAGCLSARDAGLIRPILVGSAKRMAAAAATLGRPIADLVVEDVDDEAEAARRAVAMVAGGRGRALMKGHLHTDLLLAPLVSANGGLRGSRRISHVFVLEVPGRKRPILISDAAINIAPDLAAKVDITQNAIDLAQAIGFPEPRVGILSAVETVNPAIPSTIDAAVLSKMAERGQIRGGLVDGPLAMDNAVDLEAARTKGIASLVAGRAEVLIVPNLEAGNMLAKELTFLAHAQAAGVVVGARVPVILTSRADDERARLASTALALAQAHFIATGTSILAE